MRRTAATGSSTRCATPDGFPASTASALDGGTPTQIADAVPRIDDGDRPRRSSTSISWSSRRNVGLYSDLYALSRADRRVRATDVRGAAARSGSVAGWHDARRACRNARPAGSRVASSSTDAAWHGRLASQLVDRRSSPSPTRSSTRRAGRPTAARSPSSGIASGAMPEIVVVDVATRDVRVVAGGHAHARSSRRPGGPTARAIVAAVAVGRRAVQPLRVPARRPGARAPADAHDRRRDVAGRLAGRPDDRVRRLHADGFDLFSMPYPDASTDRCRSRPAQARRSRSRRLVRPAEPRDATLAQRIRRSPTLRPTSWTPIVETGQRSGPRRRRRQSASTCSAITRTRRPRPGSCQRPSGAPTPTAARPTGRCPTPTTAGGRRFYVAASRETSFFAGPATDGRHADRRRRDASGRSKAGVVLPIRHVRVAASGARASLSAPVDDYTLADDAVTSRDRTPLRAAWRTNTARTYGYSISPEDGVDRGRDGRTRPPRARRRRRRHDRHRRRARVSAGLRAASRRRRSARPAARRAATARSAARFSSAATRPATASSTSAAAPSACCAASAPTVRRQPRRARQRRLPLADRAAAARRRHLAALSAHAPRGGVRRRRPRLDAHVSTRARSRRRPARELSANLVAGFFAPFTATRRRRVGTRRQRHASDAIGVRSVVLPRRQRRSSS